MIINNSSMTLENVTHAIDENNKHIQEDLTGVLSLLMTKNKNTLVDAINEVFQKGTDFKTAIANAIKAAGGGVVSNPETAATQAFIDALNAIQTGEAAYDKIKYVDFSHSFMVYANAGKAKNKTLYSDSYQYTPNLSFTPKEILFNFCGYRDTYSQASQYSDVIGLYDNYVFLSSNINSTIHCTYRYCDKGGTNHSLIDEYFTISNTWNDTNKTLTMSVTWNRTAASAAAVNLYINATIRGIYFIG